MESSAYYYNQAIKHENFNKDLQNLYNEIDTVRLSLSAIQNNMDKILIDGNPVDFGAIDTTKNLLISSMNYISDIASNTNLKISELWNLYTAAKIHEEIERLKNEKNAQKV